MTPRIVVLLATYNGIAHLAEQVDSILVQEGVDVRIVVSDDGSTDGTLEWLRDLELSEPRVSTLPIVRPSGNAARNFFRLLRDAEIREGELIAFADQDDIWLPRKLATQARLLEQRGADAVSGSVTAFHADGRRRIVKKDYPQRRLDYLTEGPGPGCTFLMTPRLVALARRVLAEVPSASSADFHDSLLYAIGRARGWGWHIEGEPLVDYRQHDSNVFGRTRASAPRPRASGSCGRAGTAGRRSSMPSPGSPSPRAPCGRSSSRCSAWSATRARAPAGRSRGAPPSSGVARAIASSSAR